MRNGYTCGTRTNKFNDSYVCVYWRNCSLCYENNYLPINSYSMTIFNHDLTRNRDSISSLQRPKYELITTLISNLNSLEKRKKFVFSGETNLISNLKILPDNLMPDDLSIEMYSIQSTVFVLNMLNANHLKRLVLIVRPESIISNMFNELYYYFQALETLEIRAYDFKLDFVYSVFLRCFTKCGVKVLSITCQSPHESFGTVISQFLSLETLKLFIREIYTYNFKQLLSNDKFSNSLFRLCISLEIDENGYIPFLNPFINLEELNIRVEKTRNDNNGNFCTLNLPSKNRTFQQSSIVCLPYYLR
ncbi:hypothetical protein THOM_1986 [Trachipleistophora hominis]|uniref:Uncharacterized protein n=1 Tax=Trachipleistophora hominis TaxID=72359 RepID=L7JWC9_TRAHO|nr:hypothetical protein THOM_1986 [Trachipleistophora hominis]